METSKGSVFGKRLKRDKMGVREFAFENVRESVYVCEGERAKTERERERDILMKASYLNTFRHLNVISDDLPKFLH